MSRALLLSNYLFSKKYSMKSVMSSQESQCLVIKICLKSTISSLFDSLGTLTLVMKAPNLSIFQLFWITTILYSFTVGIFNCFSLTFWKCFDRSQPSLFTEVLKCQSIFCLVEFISTNQNCASFQLEATDEDFLCKNAIISQKKMAW